ncbi:MAG TPA: hypothetical protein VNT26_21685 [Candidatus Sulfotelmatobacter sp.]|nr:hypothetical protein [Candidatus Sulfotelmatobacter sp.]
MKQKANLKGCFTLFNREGGKLIATFGQARLIKRVGRQYELHGGSKEDRLSAHEWVSLFMHEAVVKDGTRHRAYSPSR